jgi:TonB family protein
VLPLGFLGALVGRVLEVFAPVSGVDGTSVLAPVRAVLDPRPALDSTGTLIGAAAAAFIAIWAVGAGAGLLRLVREFRAMRRMVSTPQAALTRSENARLQAALSGTGIPTRAVRVTEAGTMPAVVGLRRPAILIPRTVLEGLSMAELRAVLLHEEAHRHRRDPLRLAVYRALAAVFFFYPPLGLLLAKLRESAELVCDEGALRAGARPEDLTRALARTVRLGLSPVRFAAAAESGNVSLLRRRFERLSNPRRYPSMIRHRLFFTAAAILVATLSFAPLSGCSDRSRLTETDGCAAKSSDTGATAEVQPVPVKTQAPEYPDAALEIGLEGTVMVQVHIAPDGSVENATLVPDQDAPGILADAALDAARQWRFQPLGDAAPSGADVAIPFRFQLDDKQK